MTYHGGLVETRAAIFIGNCVALVTSNFTQVAYQPLLLGSEYVLKRPKAASPPR